MTLYSTNLSDISILDCWGNVLNVDTVLTLECPYGADALTR